MSKPHPHRDLACRNCGTAAPLRFCPECGQETALHPPTLGEFLHEFIGHYVALEGALWRSLSLLLLRPGRLTREYLAGRRRRYVLPLRLYLSASFLFFVVLKLLPLAAEQAVVIDQPGDATADVAAASAPTAASAASAVVPSASASSEDAQDEPDAAIGNARPASSPKIDVRLADCGELGEPVCSRTESFFNRIGARYVNDPIGLSHQLKSQLMSAAPYAIFLLLPAFTGIVMLAYRGRRMTYGEHFVFSLHLHAFWFFALLLMALLPSMVGNVLSLAVMVYGVSAMREVYRGRWLATILRALFISSLYGLMLLAGTGVLVLGLLAMA